MMVTENSTEAARYCIGGNFSQEEILLAMDHYNSQRTGPLSPGYIDHEGRPEACLGLTLCAAAEALVLGRNIEDVLREQIPKPKKDLWERYKELEIFAEGSIEVIFMYNDCQRNKIRKIRNEQLLESCIREAA